MRLHPPAVIRQLFDMMAALRRPAIGWRPFGLYRRSGTKQDTSACRRQREQIPWCALFFTKDGHQQKIVLPLSLPMRQSVEKPFHNSHHWICLPSKSLIIRITSGVDILCPDHLIRLFHERSIFSETRMIRSVNMEGVSMRRNVVEILADSMGVDRSGCSLSGCVFSIVFGVLLSVIIGMGSYYLVSFWGWLTR